MKDVKGTKIFPDRDAARLKIDDIPIFKHLKEDAIIKETELTNKDSGKFAEIIGSRILWNSKQSNILNEVFPDINIISARRVTGLKVGDFVYKISYKKNNGYGQKIAIFEVKHGNILIKKTQFEKYCRIISNPKDYFRKAESVHVIFMMFEEIDTLGKKAVYSFRELDKDLAVKFLETYIAQDVEHDAESYGIDIKKVLTKCE